MKIVHTADIHLDQSYAALELPPALGNENRAHLKAVLQRILNRARDWKADAVFVTGDLFEHERVTRGTVNFLREAFAAAAPLPIFLCSGRSDPAVHGSPYLTEPWPANVHLFTSPAWRGIELPGLPLTVHGFGLDGTTSGDALPEGLEIPGDGRVHVAIGHGLDANILLGAREGGAAFETPPALPAGLAWLGLGGFHAATEIAGCGAPVWYAGAPEPQTTEDAGPQGFLEVEIDETEEQPRAAVAINAAAGARFHRITLDCTAFTSGQELLDAVRAEIDAQPACAYFRLALEGALLRPIYDELDGIRDALSEEVRYLQWRDDCLVGEDYEALAAEHTSLGAFTARISEEIADAPSHALRRQRERSRDLGVCAYRATPLPIKGIAGDYR